MEFRTLVELPKKELNIKHTHKLMLFGSCFAENIGNLLLDNKFDCDVNPFGVLYNPLSILNALREIMDGKVYAEKDLFNYQDYYHSYMHHGSFSESSCETCLKRINERLGKANKNLPVTDYLLITFGTAFVYSLKDTGQIVSNCHKLPESYFERTLLTSVEIAEKFEKCISDLLLIRPNLKFLFTVSPIRHIKDGMHGNQLSKSTLLLAIQDLKKSFPEHVYYFPSYELLVDELRDYRFYADDMLHPSQLAISYIWTCFGDSYFSKETFHLIQEWSEIRKALRHKPFRPDSMQYKTFLRQIMLRIERLKEKCPNLDVEKELELCHTLLK